jgi:peptidoglycan/xylan/chitin deacetylase (PgdA/CDA1 family)
MERLVGWLIDLKRRALYRRCLAAPSRAVILRYHSVGDPEVVSTYADPALSLPPGRFREQLRVLKERFEIVPLERLVDRADCGRTGPPIAALTFDDGYRDNHDVVVPILESETATATFYVTSRPLEAGRWFWISELRRLVSRLPPGELVVTGLQKSVVPAAGEDRTLLRRDLTLLLSAMDESTRERVMDGLSAAAGVPRGEGLANTFLTPEMLRSMSARGMTIGSHTRSHPHLDRQTVTRIAEEVEGGKSDLERALGTPVVHFAYPNPGGGQENVTSVQECLRAAGFCTAVTSRPSPLGKDWDPMAIPRLGVYAGAQERTLFRMLRS